MNTHNEEQEAVTNSAYNPFPEPQTIPIGWDMSELVAALRFDNVGDEDDSPES